MTAARVHPRLFVTLLGGIAVFVTLAGCPQPAELSTVPYVSGLLESEAEAALVSAGLTVGDVMSSYSDVIGAGRVLLQNPYPGIRVARGTAVALVVSAGPVPAEAPNVVGMTQADAEAAVLAAGFTSAVTEVFSETVAVGTVVGQSPAGGEHAPEGSEIMLEVSKGPDRVTVPDVTGMTQSEATDAIEEARLALGTVTELWSDTVEAGRVVSQDPAGGTEASAGADVALNVSKGPQPLLAPALVGLTIDEAEAALAALGLVLGSVEEVVADAAPDVVMAQTPAADEIVEPASAVDVVMSLGTEEMVLHTEMWLDVVEQAGFDKQFKYGIYASRSLMVAHPEVYLAADAVWMEQLATVYGGWQAEYEHRDRVNDSDYWFAVGGPIHEALYNDTQLDGSEFDWGLFQWENHRANAVALRDLYDDDAPFRNWLDMRLPLMWNALKGTGWQTPYLALGEAFYFQMRQDHDAVYLLITDSERAYVAVAGAAGPALYDPLTGEAISADAIEGEVVLAMNGETAWYPLVGRTGTDSDSGLETVVEAFCTAGSMPALTRAEADLLVQLVGATILTSDMDRTWATLFAARFGDEDAWTSRVVQLLCRDIFSAQYDSVVGPLGKVPPYSPYEHVTLNLAVTEIANRLSPAAAVLAMRARDNADSVDAALEAVNETYSGWFERADTTGVFGAYSEIWAPSLDDKVISKVGNALSEACTTGAVLYIAGIPDWQVWIAHGWLGGASGTRWLSGVYTPDGGRSVSVGVFDAGLAECQAGPIFGTGFGVPVNAVLYKVGTGYVYTGENVLSLPFSNLDWASVNSLVSGLDALEPAARFATGAPSLVEPKDLAWVTGFLATLESEWVVFEFPPLEP